MYLGGGQPFLKMCLFFYVGLVSGLYLQGQVENVYMILSNSSKNSLKPLVTGAP